MTGNELERLTKALQSDPKMIKAIKRLDKGVGTYKDVNSMAIFIGRRIAEEMNIDFSAEALTNYLVAGHGLVAMSAEAAQTNLNSAAKIGLKPKLTKTPNAKIAKAVGTVSADEPQQGCRRRAETEAHESTERKDSKSRGESRRCGTGVCCADMRADSAYADA